MVGIWPVQSTDYHLDPPTGGVNVGNSSTESCSFRGFFYSGRYVGDGCHIYPIQISSSISFALVFKDGILAMVI